MTPQEAIDRLRRLITSQYPNSWHTLHVDEIGKVADCIEGLSQRIAELEDRLEKNALMYQYELAALREQTQSRRVSYHQTSYIDIADSLSVWYVVTRKDVTQQEIHCGAEILDCLNADDLLAVHRIDGLPEFPRVQRPKSVVERVVEVICSTPLAWRDGEPRIKKQANIISKALADANLLREE